MGQEAATVLQRLVKCFLWCTVRVRGAATVARFNS